MNLDQAVKERKFQKDRVKFLGRMICAVMGKHRRGRKIGEAVKPDGSPHYAEYALYECPRCGATWNRKVKAKANDKA